MPIPLVIIFQTPGLEAVVLPVILALIELVIILYFAFGKKKPAFEKGPEKMNTSEIAPTPMGATAPVSMNPPPVQKVMEQNQVWGEKGTAKPDPFSPQPPSESQAKAKQVMQLLPFVRQYRSQGFNDSEINALLSRNGWPINLIAIALEQA